MKKIITTGAALVLTTTSAHAVGLDRSGQSIDLIFEEGTYGELSFGSLMPSISGTDSPTFNPGETASGNVAEDFTQFSLGFKTDINEQLSVGVVFDQPYGVDVSYPTAAEGGSVLLGGTMAQLDSNTVTALARYKINDSWSVHGGIRAETISGEVVLGGLAYGALDGYSVDIDGETGFGYSVGVAYERPEIALRVALTYHSEIDHSFDSEEVGPLGATSSTTDVTTPQALNLSFQTGIAADTLLFGSVRYAEYSAVILAPDQFASLPGTTSLTSIEDGYTVNLGVGRRFTDEFSGSVSFGYDTEGDDDLVSPLSPTNGNMSITLGGEYKVNDQVTVSGGVRYVKVGDAFAQTSETARAEFSGNDAIGIGVKVGYTF